MDYLTIRPEPTRAWIAQTTRHLTDGLNGFLNGCRYLIHDRSPLFTKEFQAPLQSAGIHTVRLPPRSPNLNAYAERFVRSIKESCLDRMILIGEASLHRATSQFVPHYHAKETTRVWRTSSFNQSSRCFPPKVKCAAANDSVSCFAITIAKPHETDLV